MAHGNMGNMAYGDSYFSRTTNIAACLKIEMVGTRKDYRPAGTFLDQSFLLNLDFGIGLLTGYSVRKALLLRSRS